MLEEAKFSIIFIPCRQTLILVQHPQLSIIKLQNMEEERYNVKTHKERLNCMKN